MTEHTSLIELVRLHNEERAAANQVYRKETQRIDAWLAEHREAQLRKAKASGHLVTVSLHSVARLLDLPVMDISHDYSRTLPCWDSMTQWMLLNCQGGTMLFEPSDSNEGDSDSSQTRTFAPKSTLKGSYRHTLTRHRPLNAGVLPPQSILENVQHPVDAALAKPHTISAWFELPEDAVLFKLTWS